MARFTLPVADRSAMVELAQMSETDVEKLRQALQEASGSSPGQVTRLVKAGMDLPQEQVGRLMRTLLVMAYLVEDARGYSVASISADVSTASSLDLPSDKRDTLRRRLDELLQSSVLRSVAKVERIQADYAKVYLQARLYSEIRPVFDENFNASIAVITHQLKIEYAVKPGRREAIFLALETKNLIELRKCVDREIKKMTGVDALLSAAGMVLQPSVEDD